MKEPRKARAAAVLVALAVALILSEPQPLIAQRAGAAPYPPPRSIQSPTRPNASPTGTDPRATGSSENGKRDESADIAGMLLRRRLAAELAEDFERLGRINRERLAPLSSRAVKTSGKEARL